MKQEPTCGNCRHYEPYRDIVTNAIRRSIAGKCGWKPEIKWPRSYQFRGQDPLIYQTSPTYENTPADKCGQYTPKKP